MALRYRIMVMAYGRLRSAGLPDYVEREAAADQKRILERDGRPYSILTVDLPTGTTPAQDALVAAVRDVRYRQRQQRAAIAPNRHKAMGYRLEPLCRRLDILVGRLRRRISAMPDGWCPMDTRWYAFFCLVSGWRLRAQTIDQAERLLRQAADRLVPEDSLPVTHDMVEQLMAEQDKEAQQIDDFIRAYDLAEIRTNPSNSQTSL